MYHNEANISKTNGKKLYMNMFTDNNHWALLQTYCL